MKRSPLIAVDMDLLGIIVIGEDSPLPDCHEHEEGTLLIDTLGFDPTSGVLPVCVAMRDPSGAAYWFPIPQGRLEAEQVARLRDASRQLPALKGWLKS